MKVDPKKTKTLNEKSWCVDITHKYLSSVHTEYPDVLNLNCIDPSIALGFYCRNKNDFTNLENTLASKTRNSSQQELVSFIDKCPCYMSSNSPNETFMPDFDDGCVGDFDYKGFSISDEDEYVIL